MGSKSDLLLRERRYRVHTSGPDVWLDYQGLEGLSIFDPFDELLRVNFSANRVLGKYFRLHKSRGCTVFCESIDLSF